MTESLRAFRYIVSDVLEELEVRGLRAAARACIGCGWNRVQDASKRRVVLFCVEVLALVAGCC